MKTPTVILHTNELPKPDRKLTITAPALPDFDVALLSYRHY